MMIPALGNRRKRVIVHPESSPGSYVMETGAGKVAFRPGDMIVEPVEAGTWAARPAITRSIPTTAGCSATPCCTVPAAASASNTASDPSATTPAVPAQPAFLEKKA